MVDESIIKFLYLYLLKPVSAKIIDDTGNIIKEIYIDRNIDDLLNAKGGSVWGRMKNGRVITTNEVKNFVVKYRK